MILSAGEDAKPSMLLNIEQKIESVKDNFEKLQDRRLKEGRPPLDQMSDEMFDEIKKLEARYIVTLEEVKDIKNALEKYEDEEEEEDDNLMLQKGPIGHSVIKNGSCVMFDYQKTEPDHAGIVFINDLRSPYHGLSTADYVTYVVKPWNKARTRLNREYEKCKMELYYSGKTAGAFSEAWKKRKKELFDKYPQLKEQFLLKLPGKPAMPKFPEGCKRHSIDDIEE